MKVIDKTVARMPGPYVSGEATYRVWCLYMAGCAYYFEEGSISIYQVLASPVHQPLRTLLRRNDLYEKGCECKDDE